jgi:hypothetical protein
MAKVGFGLMLIRRHIHIIFRTTPILKQRTFSKPLRFFNSIKMEVDSAVTRRERSPETFGGVADERPAKKARTEGIEPTAGGEGSSKSQSRKKSKFNKRTMQKLVHPEEGTPDDVLWHEIKDLLGESVVDDAVMRAVDLDAPLKFGDILELDVTAMSSNGVSIAL